MQSNVGSPSKNQPSRIKKGDLRRISLPARGGGRVETAMSKPSSTKFREESRKFNLFPNALPFAYAQISGFSFAPVVVPALPSHLLFTKHNPNPDAYSIAI